jgi:predicted HicB family RNase H-like nuclease
VNREYNDLVFARVDEELKARLRDAAQRQYVSENHVVRTALRELFKREQLQGAR